MAQSVCAAQHGVFQLGCEAGELRAFQEIPQAADKKIRGVAPGEQSDTVRIAGVRVQDAWHASGLERANQGGGVFGIAKSNKLHEEPAVGKLRNAIADTALLADIQFLIHGSHLTVWHRPGGGEVLQI